MSASSAQRVHKVSVGPLPSWLDARRLLGDGFELVQDARGGVTAEAVLPGAAAADVSARMRGLGFDGHRVVCEVEPPLDRKLVRRARTLDAARRRDITAGFTRRGVRVDVEGRYSLTPEALALQLGARARGLHVVDAGCGVGGNAIGFARGGATVTAIELDERRLELARHNAGVYGVAEQIRFIRGDATRVVPELDADVLFVDPPWGTDWNRVGTGLDDLPLLAALLPLAAAFDALWIKVPPSFDTHALPNARAQAVFGEAAGDRQRVKFLWLSQQR